MKPLKATHYGELNLNGFSISCAVLEDGRRVFSERSLANAFGIKGGGSYWKKKKEQGAVLPEYLSAGYLKDLISNELKDKFESAVPYLSKSGALINGVEVDVLPEICDIYITAAKTIKNNKTLTIVSENAYSMLKGFAVVGIVALVDEVTGYQDVRVKDALQQILEKYLLEASKKYEVTFPLELYKQWFRLNGWEWKPENAKKRPGIIGKWTNQYIYSRMAPGLLKELERKNPKNAKGYREYKHFSFLTDDIGEPRLREFFGGLIALAKATSTWKKYTELIERAYPAIGDQFKLDLRDEGDS
jgi:hypothetical protein